MQSRFDILYCHAPPTARKLTPGHWFFHTGQYALCASAGKDSDGRWHLQVYWDRDEKERPEGRTFRSIDEVLQFVSDYFEQRVVKIKVKDFPPPDL